MRTKSSSPSVPSAATRRGALRPPRRWADVFDSPLHDYPIRDEILFQYAPRVLAPGIDVLEVGPGSGFTAFRLACHVRRMTLFDVAPSALEELRWTLGRIPNVSFVCGDVAALDFTERLERQFDIAFGLDVLEYVRDPGACLRNLAAVLRPGGELFLTFPNTTPPAGDGVTWFTDLAELEAMLSTAGFARWAIFAVRPRRFAAAVYAVLHEWPLSAYRRMRSGEGQVRPQIYEATWAFRHRKRLRRVKVALHLYWTVLDRVMRLGGDIFAAEPVDIQPLGRQLVVRATT